MQKQTERFFVASTAADKAAAIARTRLDAGVADAFALLSAERNALAARSRLAQSQTDAATALIAVYKALAGGVSPP
jgi:multidrug efflux system outer membrane protein